MLQQQSKPEPDLTGRLGWRVRPFCKAAGISPSKFYELLGEGKIETVIIGGRRIIPDGEARRIMREGTSERPSRGTARLKT